MASIPASNISDRPFRGEWTATALVVILCTGISISNAIELLLLVLITFKRRSGLYFWSLFITSFSVLPYSVGFFIAYIKTGPHLLGDILNNIGWAILITGQSIVLYSRLGLLLQSKKTLWNLLIFILVNGFVLYTTTTILHCGTYHPNTSIAARFLDGIHIMEKVQMTLFCIQEFYISGLYIREVWRLSRVLEKGGRGRRTMWELGVINIVIVVLDIALLALEYLGFSILEQVFKGVAYSYKLKMEFAILGKLVDVSGVGEGRHLDDPSNSWGDESLRGVNGNGSWPGKRHSCAKSEVEHVALA
ncbi:hypothetical protein ONS95_002027 [Cadophora gregata]|uniref:uncharacterized protein n=1 Tax=Cadophora gregata TaxID=51156 RepID=UPI0026DD7C20|nr:uncharacterized protein ONS95_002027 [Cadophora gregata]KAK0111682.1 hypothetical protein ONS95_002027 [Cadophora gregata]KAK0111841.1 hypothetical protein ONS96_001109 [Cadophora gregata f. sp. sojae]